MQKGGETLRVCLEAGFSSGGLGSGNSTSTLRRDNRTEYASCTQRFSKTGSAVTSPVLTESDRYLTSLEGNSVRSITLGARREFAGLTRGRTSR